MSDDGDPDMPLLRAVAARHVAEDASAAPATEEHADRGALLCVVRDADAALTAAGVPDDGRPLADRIADLARVADYEGDVAGMALQDLDKLDRLLSLRVRFYDEPAAAKVTPEQANAYLAARGWTLHARAPRDKWHVWNCPAGQVLVPAVRIDGHGRAFCDLLNALATIEQRSPIAVWLDMLAAPAPYTPRSPVDVVFDPPAPALAAR